MKNSSKQVQNLSGLIPTPKANVSIQPKKTSKNITLLMAYINANFKEEKIIEGNFSFSKSKGLKEKNVKKNTKYKPVTISTGISLPSIYFDSKTKTCIGEYKHLNSEVEAFKQAVMALYNDNLDSIHSPDDLKGLISRYIHTKQGKTVNYTSINSTPAYSVPTDFVEYIRFKIKFFKTQNLRSDSSLKSYNKLANHIENFGKKINLLNITNQQIDELMIYFKNLRVDDKPMKLNTISNFQKDIKSFINKAKNEDDIETPVKLNLNRESLKKKTENDDTPPLTMVQLNKILAVKIDDDESILKQAKAIILIGGFSGLRYEDILRVKNLTHDKKKNRYYFDVLTDKTEVRVKIPVMDKRIIELYKRNKEQFNFNMANQTFNECFKILGLRAKLTNKITKQYINTSTNKPTKETFPYYTKLSSKVLRKTFASMMIRDYNLPLQVVMGWTGHTNEAIFKIYCNITPSEYYEMSTALLDKMKLI